MKLRNLFLICLSALMVLTAGCSAPSGSAHSANSTAAQTTSSGVSSFSSSEASSAVIEAFEPTPSKPASSEKSILKNTSSAPKASSKKEQNGGEWMAYIDGEHNLRVKKQDGTDDRLLVKEVAEAPCAAGEWVYYMPNLDEIDKIKLDGSQKTKVCGTEAFVVYNANLNQSHEINGSSSVTAEYKDGYILYTCFQLHETGDKPNPESYYKLDPKTNKITKGKEK